MFRSCFRFVFPSKKLLKNPHMEFKIFLLSLFQFHRSIRLEFPTCRSAKSPPLCLRSKPSSGLFSVQVGLFTNLARPSQYPQIMCMSTCIYYVSHKYNDYNNVTIRRNLPTLSEIKNQLRTYYWSHKYNDYNNVTIRRNLPTLRSKTKLRTFYCSYTYNDYNNVTIQTKSPHSVRDQKPTQDLLLVI